MKTRSTTETVNSKEGEAILSEAIDESEVNDSSPEQETPERDLPEQDLPEQDLPEQSPPEKISRFRQVYRRYRAKGKWFVVGFFVFYLIRDTILYIILPWYLAKGGISLFDWLFGN